MISENYSLELTGPELYWLASAWGFTRLPLLDNPFQGLFQSEVDLHLDDALKSLLKRGLIKSSNNFGWQMDRVPAGLVRWIATANKIVEFEVLSRSEEVIHAIIYYQDGNLLSLLKKDDSYEFTLYQQPSGMVEQLITWVGAGKTSEQEKTISIPSQVSGRVIRNMWRDKEVAHKYLENSGWDDSSILPWLEKTDRFANLTFIQIQAENILPTRQLSFVGQETQIWLFLENDDPGFSPIGREHLEDKLRIFCEVTP